MKIIFTLLVCLTLTAQASDPVVDELKQEILTLSHLYEGKEDRSGELQKMIDDKVKELERVLPYSTMEERASKILGSWRQVFGPYSPTGDGTIPFGTDTSKIYQVIFPDGLFYNVALSRVFGLRAVVLLKGSYQVTSEAIDAVFTRNSVLLREIPEQRLFELAQKLEANQISVVHLPTRLKPVGVRGQLFEVYADEDIRIVRGMTESFIRPALYVMEKAE